MAASRGDTRQSGNLAYVLERDGSVWKLEPIKGVIYTCRIILPELILEWYFDVLEVLCVEKVKSIPTSACGKLDWKPVVVRRCAGAAQFSVSDGEVGHLGSA